MLRSEFAKIPFRTTDFFAPLHLKFNDKHTHPFSAVACQYPLTPCSGLVCGHLALRLGYVVKPSCDKLFSDFSALFLFLCCSFFPFLVSICRVLVDLLFSPILLHSPLFPYGWGHPPPTVEGAADFGGCVSPLQPGGVCRRG